MSNKVQWGKTELAWAPDGYRLTLTVWIDVRASMLFEQRLPEALQRFEEFADSGEFRYEFAGGGRWQTERGADSEAAVLTIIAPRTIFAIDPEKLRIAFDDLASTCQAEADEQHERDEEIAEDWLAKVRALSPDAPN